MKKVLLQACVIAAVATWAGVLSAQFWPLQARLQVEGTGGGNGTDGPPPPVLDDPTWPPIGDEVMIDVATAHLAWENGFAEFVDARNEEEYERAHVQGAWNISQADLAHSGVPSDFVEFVSKDVPLIIYCEGGDCDTSENVAIRLHAEDEYDYRTVYILKPGIPGWVKAGHPMDGEDVEGFTAEVEAYED